MLRLSQLATPLIFGVILACAAAAQPRDLIVPAGTSWEQAEYQGRAQAFVRTDNFSFVISCIDGRDDLAIWLPRDFFNRSRTSSVANLQITSDGRFLQNAPLNRSEHLITAELSSTTLDGFMSGEVAVISFPVTHDSAERTVALQFPTTGSAQAIEQAQCGATDAHPGGTMRVANTFDFIAFQAASKEVCREVRLDFAFNQRVLQVTNPPTQFLLEMTQAHGSVAIYARRDEFIAWIDRVGCVSPAYEAAVASALEHLARY